MSAAAPCKHRQECHEVIVIREQPVVVEVDVVAVGIIAASAAGEDSEEVDKVVVIREQTIVVEVDAVAKWHLNPQR